MNWLTKQLTQIQYPKAALISTILAVILTATIIYLCPVRSTPFLEKSGFIQLSEMMLQKYKIEIGISFLAASWGLLFALIVRQRIFQPQT